MAGGIVAVRVLLDRVDSKILSTNAKDDRPCTFNFLPETRDRSRMLISRPLGTMVVHAPPRLPVTTDLTLARRLGATLVEVLPEWNKCPDPGELGHLIREEGFTLHSAHGCWGSRTLRASRVDLAATDEQVRLASCADIRGCVEWLALAGGTYLIVHPGGLSDLSDQKSRTSSLCQSLAELAEFARSSEIVICVENMPPGVFPGSQMSTLANLVAQIGQPSLALALDTGHAHVSATPTQETLAAGPLLATTHVHDNNGRQDTHMPPGLGTISWVAWVEALDKIGYAGPIMLECIRQIRENPSLINPSFRQILRDLTRLPTLGT